MVTKTVAEKIFQTFILCCFLWYNSKLCHFLSLVFPKFFKRFWHPLIENWKYKYDLVAFCSFSILNSGPTITFSSIKCSKNAQ